MKEYVGSNLYSQLLQRFTVKTKNFLSQWKVLGLPLQTRKQLQLFFIKWIFEKYDKDIPLYLGGCVDGDITGVVKVCSIIVPDVPVMKCGHKEADNKILFHINHFILIMPSKMKSIKKIIVASTDTDVFVSCLFHLTP